MAVTSRFVPRTLVQSIPTVVTSEFVGVLGAGGTRNVDFDVLTASCEPLQIGPGVPPTAAALIAVGPYLDAVVTSDQVLQLNVFYAISGGTFGQISSSAIPAGTPQNLSGLRITGHYVRVQLVNNTLVAANIQLGVYVRST